MSYIYSCCTYRYNSFPLDQKKTNLAELTIHCIEVILHYSRISSTHPTEDNLFHSYALCRCCEAFGCLHIGVDAGLLEEYGKKDFLAFLMCSRVRSRPLTPFFDPTLQGCRPGWGLP